jgi:uncharacterized membrane protein
MRFLLAILAIAGLTVSVLALKVHNMDPGAAPPCAVSEHWDCGAVNHSRFAVFPPRTFDEAPNAKGHVPVAIVGIIGYALIAVLALFGRFWIVLHLAEFGFMCACFLSYLEAFVMEKWCIYCVWSQGLMTALLVAAALAVWLRRRRGRQSIFA